MAVCRTITPNNSHYIVIDPKSARKNIDLLLRIVAGHICLQRILVYIQIVEGIPQSGCE